MFPNFLGFSRPIAILFARPARARARTVHTRAYLRTCRASKSVRRLEREMREKEEAREGRLQLGRQSICVHCDRPRTSFFRSSSLSAFAPRALDRARGNRFASRLEKFQKAERKRICVSVLCGRGAIESDHRSELARGLSTSLFFFLWLSPSGPRGG